MSTQSAPRIYRLVVALPATLQIEWHDGRASCHDLSAQLLEPWAVLLRDPAMFVTARLEDDGWQIVWPGTDIALSAQGLWDDIHPPASAPDWMAAAELRAWMQQMGWSFREAAEALGVSKRMLKYYAAGGHPIPKPVWLACMQLAAARAHHGTPAHAA